MEDFTAGNKWGVRYSKYVTKYACVALGVAATVVAPQVEASNDVAKKETNRRVERSLEAKKLVVIGDAAYEAKNHKEAVASYGKALALLPDAEISREYKEGVRDRYAQAVVAYSTQLNRVGKYEEAQALLGELLKQDDFKKKQNLKIAKNQLDDPIRSNPSSSAKHTKNVDTVRMLLYKANGAYNLGDFDLARKHYDQVLRIDRFNTAARRGIDRLNKEKAHYGRVAHGEARSRLLTKVDQAWENKPVDETFRGNPDAELLGGEQKMLDDVRGKLSKITIPRFDVEDITVELAISRFRQVVRDADLTTSDVAKKGVNINLNLGDSLNLKGQSISKHKFSINVKNIPADRLLGLICRQSGCAWTANQFAVTVLPAGQDLEQFYTRQFNVPPGFFDTLGSQSKGGQEDDPFADDSGDDSVKQVNQSPVALLKAIGASFPKGTSASFIRNSGLLTVRNNPENIQIIANAVERAKNNQSVIVNLKLKVIDVFADDLNELSYDWLLGSQKASNTLFVGGGNAGNGTQVLPINPSNGLPQVSSQALTSGLRSGDGAISSDSLNNLINSGSSSQRSASLSRAPGTLAVTGYLNNSNVQMIIRGLSQKSDKSRIWSPSVTTRPAERARIESVRLFTYPTEYDPPEVPDNVGNGEGLITPATPTTFEERPIGSVIELEPVVSPDRKYISLDIDASFSEFLGFVDYGSPIMGFGTNAITGLPVAEEATPNSILMPVFEEIKTTTKVNIADGATVVLAGLTRMDVENVTDSVPVLGSLPLVGSYFKSNAKKSIKRSVIIFATAELVDPTGKPWRTK